MKRILVGFTATLAASIAFAAASTTTTLPTMTSSGSSATISAPVEKVAPAPKKITLSYVAENSTSTDSANRGNWESSDSAQHVGFAYDLGEGRKAQFRQYFYYNLTDAKRTDEWSVGEHVFQYTDAKSLSLGEADISTYARLYLPGSEYVKDVGQYQLRVVNGAAQVFGKASLEYGLNQRFFAYTGDDDGQRGYRVIPSVTANYEVNKHLKPFAVGYTDHGWYRNGNGIALLRNDNKVGLLNPSSPVNTDAAGLDFGAGVTINKNISFNIYVESEINMRKSYAGANQFFDTQTQTYYLDFFASL